MNPLRRVIAGLDSDGRSCVMIDGPSKMVIWSTDGAVADNSGTADAGGGQFGFPTSGTRFIFSDFAPGFKSPVHATNTIDYIVVVSGEVVFATETGETVLKAGDVIVDRGIVHAWRNDSEMPARIVSVLCPSLPVGTGATMSGLTPGAGGG
jgi:quercetin dioxygenase-like cupin family protein